MLDIYVYQTLLVYITVQYVGQSLVRKKSNKRVSFVLGKAATVWHFSQYPTCQLGKHSCAIADT